MYDAPTHGTIHVWCAHSTIQTDAPMVPFMYDALIVSFMYEELEKILCRLLGLIYRKEALSEKIQNIMKKDWLRSKVSLFDLSKIDIGGAAQTSLTEVLLKSEKQQRFLTVSL